MNRQYRSAVNVYLTSKGRRLLPYVAGMLRGLACSFSGFRAVSTLTNARFSTQARVRFEFSSVQKAFAFKAVAESHFGQYIVVKKIWVKP